MTEWSKDITQQGQQRSQEPPDFTVHLSRDQVSAAIRDYVEKRQLVPHGEYHLCRYEYYVDADEFYVAAKLWLKKDDA